MLRNKLTENVKNILFFGVSKLGFPNSSSKLILKTPKIEKLNFWFTLKGSVYDAGRCLVCSLDIFVKAVTEKL